MKKRATTLLAILGLTAATAAGPALADDEGLYFGGSVGHAESGQTCTSLALANCRDHDEAWRIFAGYRFSRAFAVELGFANLGTIEASGAGPVAAEVESQSWDVAAVLSFPIAKRLSILGRFGAYYARTRREIVSGTGIPLAGDAGGGLTYGVGAGFDLGPLGLRAEWQRYANLGGITTEESIDVFSLGALFRF